MVRSQEQAGVVIDPSYRGGDFPVSRLANEVDGELRRVAMMRGGAGPDPMPAALMRNG